MFLFYSVLHLHFQVTSTSLNLFMPLLIHETPPLKVKLLLKSVPSCEKSNIIVFTQSNLQCELLSDIVENDLVTCVYNCMDVFSSKINIGFFVPWDRQPKWSICEIIMAWDDIAYEILLDSFIESLIRLEELTWCQFEIKLAIDWFSLIEYLYVIWQIINAVIESLNSSMWRCLLLNTLAYDANDI